MGKRSAVVELFLGDMGSIQRELRPSTQREDQLTMETKLEQIAVKAVNQLPKSVGAGDRLRRPGGMGNGALPNGPSYRAHPRLYHSVSFCCAAACPLSGETRKTYAPGEYFAF